MPWWGWLAIGMCAGILIVGTPVLIVVNRFIRDLDEATGWGGWRRARR